jgi:hypothetical protein
MESPKIPADNFLTLPDVLAQERTALGVATTAQPQSALCISGGGIRSATFALGIIQGLADHGLLGQFDYLSTVSGGGYIGSWLTAWVKRAQGVANVIPYLRRDGKRPAPGEADPIDHLREYNNYLTPKLGFFSADTWTLAVTVLRNIMLNWLVLIPLLMGALILPRFLLAVARLGYTFDEIYGTASPVSTSPLVTIALPTAMLLLLAMAFFNAARLLPGVGGAKQTQNDYLLWVLLPLVGADLAFCAFDCLYYWNDQNHDSPLSQVILWCFAPAAVGALAYLLVCGSDIRKRARRLLLPLSAALFLMTVCTGGAAWWLTNKLFPLTTWAQYVVVAPPLLLIALDLGTWVFVGVSSRALHDEDREWLARSSAWVELFCAGWAMMSALVLLLPGYAFQWKAWGNGLLGAIGGLSGWFSSRAEASVGKKPAGLSGQATGFLIKLAPLVFLIVLMVGLAVVTNAILVGVGAVFPSITWLPSSPDQYSPGVYPTASTEVSWTDHDALLEHTYWGATFLAMVFLFVFSWLMSRFINTNTFSLHGMYRNRLIRAYLGASNPKRDASGFTGFADSDNIPMTDLPPTQRPFHVVNVSLNLVAGDRLAWQQRKAQSFTVSPLHSGNFELGYRPSAAFGGGITLGTAVTISGAAASPNMGHYSSPVIGFIMTLFNARLGSWLGNPGPAGDRTWTHSGPHSAVQSIVKEAFGLTNNTSSYVYLSDGGHFENLALYEMVIRRCRHIVVLDGAADPEFGYADLGNALRKIRIDLNVPIDFEDDLILPLRGKTKRCAVATIRYSALDSALQDGTLIYVKPILLGTEPPDVESYAVAHTAFPHESTADQWFDESQTESYRMLGLHTMDEICEGWSGGPFAEFSSHVKSQYLRGESKAKPASA